MLTLHLLGHTWILNGWQASLATAAIAFHDFILWPIFFVAGRVTKRQPKKPVRVEKAIRKVRKS